MREMFSEKQVKEMIQTLSTKLYKKTFRGHFQDNGSPANEYEIDELVIISTNNDTDTSGIICSAFSFYDSDDVLLQAIAYSCENQWVIVANTMDNEISYLQIASWELSDVFIEEL